MIAVSHESAGDGAHIVPDWGFDIMHEFVYQFQGFCQLRTRNSSKEDLDLLAENKDCWAVETVMYYLHALVNVSGSTPACSKAPGQIQGILGHFAILSLSRLSCLLGDFSSSLTSLSPLSLFSTTEMFSSIFPARLSLFYHAGVSFFVLRRYRDAARVMQDMVRGGGGGEWGGGDESFFFFQRFNVCQRCLFLFLPSFSAFSRFLSLFPFLCSHVLIV